MPLSSAMIALALRWGKVESTRSRRCMVEGSSESCNDGGANVRNELLLYGKIIKLLQKGERLFFR